MFALGNDAAAQLLIPELNTYHYSSNLAALRYLFNGFTQEYWNSSLYRQWLNALRKMNPPDDKSALPPFMNTAAFWQQKLNTQLASWAELRHDNLLYAKQSYTGVPICSYPYSYVEPFPELFEALINIGSAGYNYFQDFIFSDPYIKSSVLGYFTSLQTISDTLRIISQKELDNIQLSEQEMNFLKNMMFEVQNYAGTNYEGWFPKLLYRDNETNYTRLMGKDYLVADIHTTPSDCFGAMHGWVKHVGTGPVDMGVFIAKIPGGQLCAFAGPLLSFRDYTTNDWLRLTDEEWNNEYLFYSMRPDWVNIYLADSSGNSRGPGLQLITSVENIKNKTIPSTQLIARNYPNPFNPSTIISFTIPFNLTNSQTELIVYNIQGEVVKKLVDEILPSGNYVTRWDGTNELGNQVTSGIYIYSLRVADKQVSGKMTFMK
jgi:hypothetical protein